MADYVAGTASLKVRPDADDFVKLLRRDMAAIADPGFTVTINPDTTRALAAIDRFRAEQGDDPLALDVDADTAGARAHLDEFRSAQRARAIDIPVKADRGGLLDSFNSIAGEVGKAFSAIGGGLKFPLVFAGIGELPAITTALTSAAGAVEQLMGAGAALPGVLAGAGASIGTLKFGLSGVKEALDAVWANDGSAAGIKKVNEAMKDLSPTAREFVTQLGELKPQFDSLKRDLREGILTGLGGDIRHLVDADLPNLRTGLGGIARAWNENLRQLTSSLGSDSSRGLLDRILGNTGEAQAKFTAAIDPLVKGIGTLAAAGTDVLPRLADDFSGLATRFSNFITEADKSGALDRFINDGITGVEQLGGTFLNLGKGIASITEAAGGGKGLLELLDEGSAKLRDFLASTEGQNQLKRWFAEGREQLGHLVDLAKDVGPILKGMFEAGKDAADVLVPLIKNVVEFVNDIPGGAKTVVEAFLLWKGITAVGELSSSLTSIGGLLDGLGGKARNAGQEIEAGLGGGKGDPKKGKGKVGRWGGGWGGGAARLLTAGIPAALALEAANDGPDVPTSKPVSLNDAHNGDLNQLFAAGGAVGTGWQLGGPAGAAAGAVAAIPVVAKMQADQNDAILREFARQMNEAKGDDSRQRELQNLFYGENVFDPRKLQKLLGSDWSRQSIREAAGRGDFKEAGIDAGNVDAIFDKALANAKLAGEAIDTLGNKLKELPDGHFEIVDPTPAIFAQINDLGLKITHLPNGKFIIDANTDVADNQMKAFFEKWKTAVLGITPGVIGAGAGRPFTPRTTEDGPAPSAPGGVPNPLNPGGVLGPTPPRKDGGPTPSGPGPGPTGGFIAELHPDEYVISARGRAAVPDSFLHALNQGIARPDSMPRFFTGGPGDAIINPDGSPVTPGPRPGPDTVAGPPEGIGGVATSFLSGLGRSAGLGKVSNLLGAGSGVDEGRQSPDQQADWLGKFGAKTLLSLGTSLWSGFLGLFNLQDSILSPSNPYFQALTKSAGFYLGDDGPLAGSSGSGGAKAATTKQVREAEEKVADTKARVAEATARLSEVGAEAKAKASTTLAAKNALDKANREAADAAADLQNLMQYGTGGRSAYQPGMTQVTDPSTVYHHHYAGGGPTPSAMGPFADGGYPAVVHPEEFMISARGRATVPDSFLHALNEGRVDPDMLPHFRDGGLLTGAVIAPPRPNVIHDPAAPPAARPYVPPVATVTPPPAAPAAPPMPPTSEGIATPSPMDTPVSQPLPPPIGTPQPSIGPAPTSLNHNLDAVNTGITSGAAAVGNALSAAASAGGGLGAGAAGQFAAGLAQEVGKSATDAANVVSSFLVGDTSLGTTDRAYGYTALPAQQQPDTLPYGGGYGGPRTVIGSINGHNTNDVIRELRVKEDQDAQGFYANK